MRPVWTVIAVFALGAAAGAGGAVATATSDDVSHQQARLAARSVLPSATFRAGSPPSGAFFTAQNRTDAIANGVPAPASGPIFTANQPVQGISAVIPAGHGQWWALADNGYGTRETSADWQLPIYRMDLGLGTGTPSGAEDGAAQRPAQVHSVEDGLRPDGGHRPAAVHLQRVARRPSPPPAGPTRPPGCSPGSTSTRSRSRSTTAGTFWIGDEFGPFVLHADRQGRLLGATIAAPGVKSPQNPTLNVLAGERPTVAQSRGLESMAIDPARKHLYPMFEGAVGDDNPQDLRILELDLRTHRFTDHFRRLRLEMPGAKVNLSTLTLVGGAPAYPGTTPPTGTGGESAAELTAVNSHQFLVVERDSNGDALAAPRFKKIFLLDTAGVGNGGYVDKTAARRPDGRPRPRAARRRRRLLPVPVQHHRVRARRQPRHDPDRERQQLPVLQRPVAQPHQRAHRAAGTGRQRVHPHQARPAARRRSADRHALTTDTPSGTTRDVGVCTRLHGDRQ